MCGSMTPDTALDRSLVIRDLSRFHPGPHCEQRLRKWERNAHSAWFCSVKPANVTVSEPSVPDAVPDPYSNTDACEVDWKDEDEVGLNRGVPVAQPLQPFVASQRSEEPVSSTTSKDCEGEPTLMDAT
jgi:hypothetical protein